VRALPLGKEKALNVGSQRNICGISLIFEPDVLKEEAGWAQLHAQNITAILLIGLLRRS